MRRRCTWNIFQSIEYADEQDQTKLYNFFGFLMDHFTPASSERKLISHIFRENDICRDTEWERYNCCRSVEVPDSYTGPRLTFPMTFCGVSKLVEAFKHRQKLHACYVLQLLGETWRLLQILPNINHVSFCHTREITICGDLHGHLEDLLLIFYKNGLPSSEKPYVFNGDFVDRGKNSLEILLILFGFLLVYPNNIHLNRGNHEDHIVNLRYGFTKEVAGKYRVHGKKILKLLQKIFSSLPLATMVDHKVLIVHGGISESTDLNVIARLDRHKYVSTLKPPMQSLHITSSNSKMADPDRLVESRRRVRSLPNQSPTPAGRHDFPRRSLQNPPVSDQLYWSVEKELRKRRRDAGFDQSYGDMKMSDSAQDPEDTGTDDHEWKQIVDMLWSDPMPQNGCIPNKLRGGGCYWGPDVTENVLGRHNLQLLIRSHECKQDGYEFCHNRRVLTIFSASNYYEVGSNRGAYIRMGPNLNPHLVQYQASSTCIDLTLRQSVGWTERSALQALRQQVFVHKSDLISAFQAFDPDSTGLISTRDWASATESILKLGLPWRVLRPQLVSSTQHGKVEYRQWIRELSLTEPHLEISDTSILEIMYKNHSNLETIFRVIDTDHSGLISLEEFRQTWKLLSSHLKMEISDKTVADLAQSIDFNKDGVIDINEFMEAFRLVGISAHK
ncbi:serine/threonine-protein phosphatase with EF-hands 2-like isoform X1 [Phyllopteryx taeniolatus]|uniref:serine/threonine-protein phosphatase with EF-hands 2-like isoform X1 n=2 Tax=Phyllopteryx taeniolatus TaxID=161469 RepID=UPI002AD555F1|nr:serine/threonine-protein phosphatase with EF-hands 2-like isoform X1 [Phyllopteryx taeniolatus]XP_061655383.1 serine/threonine-protein phosphatase with EF-hands 2-like isoform X1 [Phyllopteryx taeniolatus]XP_061655384.1 serine/threonine-protein phosphatase with EF-hands 2-like isoform X1 [Phyllopteryx taeniolatus]XP_061655385.1 serine/threonine-protein phosphatase with EF-hands 2-like isoform X1 [Phyllopteryx taeniolatus]